jgi:arylsulfatase A-like enzyme
MVNIRWICCLAVLIAGAGARGADKPNVLFIAVDDLRPMLGCYGDRTVLSPNIDKLAASGVRFDRAYCQFALCNPSRASLLSGRRPTTLKIHTLAQFVRDKAPDVVTLPQMFKEQGYQSLGYGKIFHITNGNHEDDLSWSRPAWHSKKDDAAKDPAAKPAAAPKKAKAGAAKDGADHSDDEPAESPDVADNALLDGQIADRAVEALRNAGRDKSQPFFLAVGFHKPHMPFVAPKKYWDLYRADQFQMPASGSHPKGAPDFAGNDASELRRYKGIPATGPAVTAEKAIRLIHGYHACVSYTDAQVGRVLDALDANGLKDNTIVVLWGDHGYHLGEQGTWNKRTNWELATRVPLIIRKPGPQPARRESKALVELLDLYPTLAELCGLKAPDKLEGTSLVPLLANPDQPWKEAVFSNYVKKVPELGDGNVTGIAMRTANHRWVRWSGGPLKEPVHELYDHTADPQETVNIAGTEAGQRVIAQLAEKWSKGGYAAFGPPKSR